MNYRTTVFADIPGQCHTPLLPVPHTHAVPGQYRTMSCCLTLRSPTIRRPYTLAQHESAWKAKTVIVRTQPMLEGAFIFTMIIIFVLQPCLTVNHFRLGIEDCCVVMAGQPLLFYLCVLHLLCTRFTASRCVVSLRCMVHSGHHVLLRLLSLHLCNEAHASLPNTQRKQQKTSQLAAVWPQPLFCWL